LTPLPPAATLSPHDRGFESAVASGFEFNG
jgi:hypothetical protein